MSHVRKGSARVAGRRQADQGPHMVRKKVFFALAVALMVAVMVVGFILENSVSPVVTRLFGTLVDAPSEAAVTTTNDSARALASEVEAQGAVLLANDGTLPLSNDVTKVNVFGWASSDWLGGGSGSGCVTSVETDLISALNDAGIETNTELTAMYQDFRAAGKRPQTLSSKPEESSVLYEPSIADRTCYTDELLQNAQSFSDTAIVVLQRYAGESNDMPLVQYKVSEKNGSVATDASRTSLDLSTEEEALLAYVGATYKNVIVVVNSANAMALGALDSTPGIDAVLLAGYTGQYGAEVLPQILWGEVSPSGRTADTYAYDLSTAPSYASASNHVGAYALADGLYPADGTQNGNFSLPEGYDQVSYVDYSEGVYVGYRWYETADAEGFWDSVSNEHGTGYQGIVQYPFGYGLSYTTFDWGVVDAPAQGSELGDSASVTVRVTNTGSVAGRDVVELYYSAPYVPGGIEKSAVVLGDYAKTGLIAPGESEDVTLAVSARTMASYDCYDANGNGFEGWELDPGTYTLTLRHDAHTVDNAEGATLSLVLSQGRQFPVDEKTGVQVTNRFTGQDATDGVGADGLGTGQDITYLSRADFVGTYPKVASTRAMPTSVAALNLYTDEERAADDARGATMPTTGARNGLAIERNGVITGLGRKLGANYNDPQWDSLLDQLTVAEMEQLVTNAYSGASALASVGRMSETRELDGPAQIESFVPTNPGTGFPCAVVLAQTWSRDLARQAGLVCGEQAAQRGLSGWYAPCANLHRTPLGGRNYEYFSEDSLLVGQTCGSVVAGARDAGVYCYVKHLALNDGEAYVYRDGVYTWLSEQTLRETYLEPFRTVVEDYGGTALMSSYNRVGAVWAGGSEALLAGVLRGEWGFNGVVVTDFSDHTAYMNGDQMLRHGGDLWMQMSGGSLTSNPSSASYVSELRRATKDFLFAYLDACVANESYVDATGDVSAARPRSSAITTPGLTLLAVLRVVSVALVGIATWRLVVGIKKKRAEKA